MYNRFRRLNNLYKITDKHAKSVVFRMNEAQKKFYRIEKEHERIIVLKARQLWMTTYKCISGLDRCLFYPNQNIIITAHKQEKQREIFTKVKYAFEQIPENPIKLSDGTVRKKPTPKYDSVNELYFPDNNSRIKVSLDSRSWTPTALHITELAFRQDARQMMTGTLPSVPKGAPITIETTANWVGNYFYELWKRSEDTWNFYPFFLPRYEDSNYRSENKYISTPSEIDHIDRLPIDDQQKQWYIERWQDLWREVFQEFPSSPEEAFLATWDCVFNSKQVKSLPKLDYEIDQRYKDLRIYSNPRWYCYLWVDTAWWSIEGDYSTIVVRDRSLKLLAMYYWHKEPDALCDIIDHLYRLWYKGVIWVERNNTWLATILKAKEYIWHDNLYAEKSIDKITNKRTKKYWRNTTSNTRPVMLAEYEEAVRKWDITTLDERLRSEMYTFYYNEKNRPEALQWAHDDAIMADAICLQMTKSANNIQFDI